MAAISDQNRPVPARSRSFEARDRGCVSVADTSGSPKGSNPVRSIAADPSIPDGNVVVSAPNSNGNGWLFCASKGKLLPPDRPVAIVFFFRPIWRPRLRSQRQIAAPDGVIGLELVDPGRIDDLALVDDRGVARQPEAEMHVLLCDQHGRPELAELPQQLADPLHDDRR